MILNLFAAGEIRINTANVTYLEMDVPRADGEAERGVRVHFIGGTSIWFPAASAEGDALRRAARYQAPRLPGSVQLPPRLYRILESLVAPGLEGGATHGQITDFAGHAKSTTTALLSDAVRDGYVRAVSSGRRRRYEITPDGRMALAARRPRTTHEGAPA